MSLGNYLKNVRLDKKLSLREASELSGLSHTYISDVEKGIRRGSNKPVTPSPETLKKLSGAYNIDYYDLLRRAGIIE